MGTKASRAKKEANIFLNSINKKSLLFTSKKGNLEPADFGHTIRLSIKDPRLLVYFECVSDLLYTDKFCPN